MFHFVPRWNVIPRSFVFLQYPIVEVIFSKVSAADFARDDDKIDAATATSGRVVVATKIACPLICEMSMSVVINSVFNAFFKDLGRIGYFTGFTLV